jgi:hypothetical protein
MPERLPCPSRRCTGSLGPALGDERNPDGTVIQEWRECGRCFRLVCLPVVSDVDPTDNAQTLPGLFDA